MTYMCQREKKESGGQRVGGLSGTTVAVSEQVDQLKKKEKKMLLECDGRRLLTFSPLFSYQMLGRKKRGRQESALSGKPGH